VGAAHSGAHFLACGFVGSWGRGQRVDGRQRRGERRPVLPADPGQDHGEPLGSHRPAAGQHLPALLGQPDLDHPPVGGVRSSRGGLARAIAGIGSPFPGPAYGPQEHPYAGTQNGQVGEHLNDEHHPGGLGFSGDVPEARL
jgi:hypothetical protein